MIPANFMRRCPRVLPSADVCGEPFRERLRVEFNRFVDDLFLPADFDLFAC
jgi:hypothetical protein